MILKYFCEDTNVLVRIPLLCPELRMEVKESYLNIHWPLKSMGLITNLLGCKNPNEREVKQPKFLNQNLKVCVAK